jgi:hypothetical protein
MRDQGPENADMGEAARGAPAKGQPDHGSLDAIQPYLQIT